MLLPGLGTLLRRRPELEIELVGAAGRTIPEDDWRAIVRDGLSEGGAPEEVVARQLEHTRYASVDVTDPAALGDLLASLPAGDPVVLYLALPPAISERATEALAQVERPEDLRVAIEKPFGADLASAQRFNALLAQILPEERVFRVDHFLGIATVLNILGLRFGNRVLSRVWNAVDVERIEVVYDEELALEGRAGYYDKAGALEDMLQSHLLLVAALLTMEEPARIDSVELRDLLTHALRAIHLWEDDPSVASRRARYTAGRIGDREIPAYVDEPGVDPSRGTETLAEVIVEVRNGRWKGVPIVLRSGKAIAGGRREARIDFRPVAHVPEGFGNEPVPDRLVLGMHPETITLTMACSGSEAALDFSTVDLYAQLSSSEMRPYGEILGRLIDGDLLLAVRGDMAEECWRIMSAVLEAWDAGEVPLEDYVAGSSGPQGWA
ncbi:glucose-6-phosphate dehydrogenase [Arsenicicoccus piscis]|uniref:glucose-6-phosphate dehydrogenase n=1 Tax=Arsenicicoccus piscis TaxID=673954 RepID=UPI001F4C728B|nr:glucose-6-phosphate dehydrogenase [Arsenicicoccus piscis]MCH8626704.1 glucose-6-phosphate dehydrogenase [Arsenicicoccus piscis]